MVIKDPNRNGAPVAWWFFESGRLQIRCYAPRGRRVMGVMQNLPTNCAYCGQPLREKGIGWRSTSRKLYCSEFCADDEEEATFQNTRHALAHLPAYD